MRCIICHSQKQQLLQDARGARFQVCEECGFIMRDRQQSLGREEERQRYLLHENSRENEGYVQYLQRFLNESVLPHAAADCRILDFGSGPLPVLTELLREAGFSTDAYDPFFAPDTSYTAHTYDLVILLEVIEHTSDPAAVIQQLSQLLNPGGIIIMQTQLVTRQIGAAFTSWWYKEDPSHISFFTRESMDVLARRVGMIAGYPGKNVIKYYAKG